MIAGNIQHPFQAASHIMDRIEKARYGLKYFVWIVRSEVHYCSEESDKIVPDYGLVGIYQKTKRHGLMNISTSNICQDIEAASPEVLQ